jgi:Spy/CpxP family protein refolding chaperone
VLLWQFLYYKIKLLPQKAIYYPEIHKHMKITYIILFLSLFTITASAQIERKPVVVKTDSTQTAVSDNKVDKQSRKERFKELDLTKEQKGKLKEIMQSGKAAKDDIENNTQLSEQDKKKQLRELQKDQMQKIQSILTPEQQEKFNQQLREKLKEKKSKQDNP